MEKTVNMFLFGKQYEVSEGLTVMAAMEYAGYPLVHGCGCRNGVCGACAFFYRIRGDRELHAGLACQTKVEDGMYIAARPSPTTEKRVYDIHQIPADKDVMRQLYPELDACIGCRACTRICPQGLDVMEYVDLARRGDFEACAEASFACVICGACSSRCPVGIDQPQVAMLARRIYGKHLAPRCGHLEDRLRQIRDGDFDEPMEALMQASAEQLKELYNNRDIEA